MINLDKSKKYLLACSYGTDSMVLFDMLYKAGFHFSVAHVNYNLRSESKKETESLKKLCDDLNIKIHILDFDKFLPKGNIEEDCRYIRYNFFKELYDKYSYDYLLVAHQQDDHIETYCLQKNRNIIASYYGLPRERELFGMKVIRPLLNVSKDRIDEYLLSNKVPHSIDSSNLLDCFERNKIRHNFVNKLTKQERENILLEIDNKNQENVKKLAKLKDLNLNSVKTLLSLDDLGFQLAFYILIEKIPFSGSISKRSIINFRNSLASDKPNLIMTFNYAIDIVKTYDEIIVQNHIPSILKEGFLYQMDKPSVLDNEYFYLNTLMDVTNRNITLNDYPLTIRNAKPNDEFIVKDYKVKMRRAFIDWKMPSYLRNRWPVIINKNNEIIYVPRYQKDFEIIDSLNFYVKY